ncbi:hypothetical protein [Paenisporosarcina sp. TG-14]|uniref:hypothetical protein n=1 Tax=Paenisporosarcina sp. TG-14 TaxID=1231057 RepID=UPI0002D2825A|nr:hypothetical protein [Paenisporosarcina sp. TG-14]
MTVKKFELKKSYEVIEIDGKKYQMELNDEALKSHRKMFNAMKVKMDALQTIDLESATEEEQDKLEVDSILAMKETIDQLLGEGSYDPIYESAGRSSYALAHLVYQLMEVVDAKFSDVQTKKKENYYKSSKKVN